MRSYLTPLVVVLALCVSDVHADTNIVTENFDSYTQSTFEAVWQPDDGNGISPLTASTGILVPDTNAGLTSPNDDPPGIMGQGINILSDINEYDTDGDETTNPFQVAPTSTQAVRLSGDMFDDIAGNTRASIGIRSISDRTNSASPTTNIIELGKWNAATTDPTDGTAIEDVSTYAYRVILFDGSTIGPPLIQSPNWQYFPLDLALDNTGGPDGVPDGLVNVADIGVGWHNYSATITETTVTLELDLYRDGLKNSEATPGVGDEGVDSSVTWTISGQDSIVGDEFDYDPFNSLRIGGPSGATSGNESVVDNISLDLIDLVAGADNADFDGSNLVDGEDFLELQRNFGTADPQFADGDANTNGSIDATDLGIFQTQYGTNPNATVSASAVPEPSSLMLASLVLLGAVSKTRFRQLA